MSYSILFLGSNSIASTSRHRADALRRLGCLVTVVDPEELLGPRSRWQSFLDYRSGYIWLHHKLLHAFKMNENLSSLFSSNLVWIEGGELYGPTFLDWISACFPCPIILFNGDDPTGPRDGARFRSLRASFPYYTLCVLPRQETALEALALGARKVLAVQFAYDERVHSRDPVFLRNAPKPVVSFIGTFIRGEARDRFLVALIQGGLPLRLIGNRWHRSPIWPLLQTIYEGSARIGPAYTDALADATVSLGFLSHQNRDLKTLRSFEVPACAGLLCAERSSEHLLLYEDGYDAVFWSSPNECISLCKKLLEDSKFRDQLCMNGWRHVHQIGVGNEDICRQILASI